MSGRNQEAIAWADAKQNPDFAGITLDLSTARDSVELDFSDGEFLYVDKSSTGSLSVAINRKENVQIYLGPGSSIKGTKFSKLYITNAAQAGKSALLIASNKGEIAPGVDVTTLDTIVNPVTVTPNDVAPIDLSNASPIMITGSGSTLNTIVTPAANINGLRVLNLLLTSANNITCQAKQSAPASYEDPAALQVLYAIAGLTAYTQTKREIFVPAGYGLYIQNGSTGSYAAVGNYLLL